MNGNSLQKEMAQTRRKGGTKDEILYTIGKNVMFSIFGKHYRLYKTNLITKLKNRC